MPAIETVVNVDVALGRIVEHFDFDQETLQQALRNLQIPEAIARRSAVNEHAPQDLAINIISEIPGLPEITGVCVPGRTIVAARTHDTPAPQMPLGDIYLNVGSIISGAFTKKLYAEKTASGAILDEATAETIDEALLHELAHFSDPEIDQFYYPDLSDQDFYEIGLQRRTAQAIEAARDPYVQSLIQEFMKARSAYIKRTVGGGVLAMTLGLGVSYGASKTGASIYEQLPLQVGTTAGIMMAIIKKSRARKVTEAARGVSHALFYSHTPAEKFAREASEKYKSLGKISTIKLRESDLNYDS